MITIIDLQPTKGVWMEPITTEAEYEETFNTVRGFKAHTKKIDEWKRTLDVHFERREERKHKPKEDKVADAKAEYERVKAFNESLINKIEGMSEEELRAYTTAQQEEQEYKRQKQARDQQFYEEAMAVNAVYEEVFNNVDIGSTMKFHKAWLKGNVFDGTPLVAISNTPFTVEDLMKVKGIGKVLANRIISSGVSMDKLIQVKGIGKVLSNRIQMYFN